MARYIRRSSILGVNRRFCATRVHAAVAATVEKLEARMLLSGAPRPLGTPGETFTPADYPPIVPTPPGEVFYPLDYPIAPTPPGEVFEPLTASSSPGTNDVTPSGIASLYSTTSAKVNGNTVDGTGITIGIVDAYIDPNLQTDIANFDSYWSLPAATVNEVQEPYEGVNPVDGSAGNTWITEVDMDVEFAHVMAPGATIDVFETPDSADALLNGAAAAANYSHVSVISMSWGGAEYSTETSDDATFATPSGHSPVTFIAASGDTFSTSPIYPSASPDVISVGGTMLDSYTSGTNEWWKNRPSTGEGSEGGPSLYESVPTFQSAVDANRTAGTGAYNAYAASGRVTPDVSMLAYSVSVYDLTDDGGSTATPWQDGSGGTSLAAPLFAGVMAMVNEGRKSYAAQTSVIDGAQTALPAIYGLLVNGRSSDINDIDSSFGDGPGYDQHAGLGSPNVPSFVNDLANVDSVLGGTGNDTISASVSGSTLTVTLNGSPSTFTIYSGTSLFVNGEAGDDTISGDSTVTIPTVMFGAGGNDSITGGAGQDYINGGGANDTVFGGASADFIAGAGGHDSLGGGSGNDTLIAGSSGGETLSAGSGTNLFISDQVIADSLASLGTGDSGYYDNGPSVYDSVSGTITLL